MDVYDLLVMVPVLILLGFVAATIWSMVLFIQDSMKAKADGRKVSTVVKAFFITMIVFNVLAVGFVFMIMVLSFATGTAGM